jgi:hypothetical protein
VALDWPLHASAVRQASVRHLVAFVSEVAGPAFPTVIAGDFTYATLVAKIQRLQRRAT